MRRSNSTQRSSKNTGTNSLTEDIKFPNTNYHHWKLFGYKVSHTRSVLMTILQAIIFLIPSVWPLNHQSLSLVFPLILIRYWRGNFNPLATLSPHSTCCPLCRDARNWWWFFIHHCLYTPCIDDSMVLLTAILIAYAPKMTIISILVVN